MSVRFVNFKPGNNPIRIATRASRLALWQAEYVAGLLRGSAADRSVELVHVSTTGDEDRARPLTEMGGVGVFTREVQRAVLDGRADIAVHSLKDLPTETPAELALAGIPPRAPRFDVLVLPRGVAPDSSAALPAGARIGTGSLRRRAQFLHAWPDLVMCDVRGNVETRLRKLDDGEFNALILAQAGLLRLGFSDRGSLVLQPPLMYPAVGQGAIGIECRADDAEMISLLDRITDPVTCAETTAERACLAALRAGCHAPVGVWATVSGATLRLEAVVVSPDGRQRLTSAVSGDVSDPPSAGREIARDLFRQGAESLIRTL